MRRLTPFLIAALLGVLAIAPAAPAAVPAGAQWSEAYFETRDDVRLHADILRPKGLPATARTPVILTVSPYTNHFGDPNNYGTQSGPSDRFKDFYEGAKLFERGYTYVIVDLRGFGGSGGCNDWGGPGEQEDVRAAVEWAASQPWSTGKVGLYGKSYDAWTGLMGLVQKPKGLAAVVSMEPVYDGYRYLYTDGVRYFNSVATPTLFTAIDATPGAPGDTPEYHVNGTAPNAACYAGNIAQQQQDEADAPFWKERELISRAKDTDVPLFLTQGFLEDNTKPDGAFDFFAAVKGPKRAWFGPWDHIRGNEAPIGRPPEMWFSQAARFFDHYVRDVPLADAPVDKDPVVEVEGSDGVWRGEAAWPPADATALTSPLKAGSYADDGANEGSGEGAGHGIWTVSPPLPHKAVLAGEPRLTATVAVQVPRSNLVVNVYDIDTAGKATMVSRGAKLLREGGDITVPLYGIDWTFAAGHRVGVVVSSSNAEWWTHVPALGDVSVERAQLSIPWLRHERTQRLPGKASDKLNAWKADAPFEVDAETLGEAEEPGFALPPALQPFPAPAAAPAAVPAPRPRLVARIAADRRRIVVFGNAPSRSRVRVTLRRGKRTVARRTVRARRSAFRTSFRVRRAGRYHAVVTTTAKGKRLVARTGRTRVR